MNIVNCRIADFNISFESDIKYYDRMMSEFAAEFDSPDFVFRVSDEDLNYEQQIYREEAEIENPIVYKKFVMFRKFGEALPSCDAFVFHSACVDVDGVGIAFAAHSGTGKTTHMNLWQRLLGNKLTIVNGDKPIVRFFGDEPQTPYVYGSPWRGKERLGCNMRTHLKHICFIERSETNFVEKIDKKTVTNRLIKQVYMPKDSIAVMDTMRLVDRLISCCDFWIIHCNMELEAAEVAYSAIINGKNEL